MYVYEYVIYILLFIYLNLKSQKYSLVILLGVVVFNNSALGFIELEQKSTGFLATGTELQNPDFSAMAEAVGVKGIRIEDPGDVEAGIAAALAHDGPVLVDAVVSRMVLPIPPSITVEMAKGFSLYMLKAVIDGRSEDLVDLARAYLWQ